MILLGEKLRKARKSHHCDASEWLFNQTSSDLRILFDDWSFTFSEKRLS